VNKLKNLLPQAGGIDISIKPQQYTSRQNFAGKEISYNHYTKISSPSLVGTLTVIAKQAVLLALNHSLPKPSQNFRSSGISWVRSSLQWRDRAGISPDFPIKPVGAPAPSVFYFSNLFKFTIITSTLSIFP